MKKLALYILLGLSFTIGAYAQSSWSFLQKTDLNAGIGIQSSDGSLNINYLKREDRSQLLLISKKDMDCLICSMEFGFSNRTVSADVEYLYKNSNNEYIYAILNKGVILRGFSYSSNFSVRNPKNSNVYNFSGNVPVKYFSQSDFSEWIKRNDFYETNSLNYYTGKGGSKIYATLGVNQRITNIQTLTFNGVNLNCNPNCDIIVYFAAGQANYKLIREDNIGKITYRLPETFIQDMKTYNRTKDTFALRVKSVERGDMIFKFDSSTYSPQSY